MQLRRITDGLYLLPGSPNTVIKILDVPHRVVVVDPGAGNGRAQDIIKAVNSLGAEKGAILLTHGHSDHIEAAPELISQGYGPVYASRYCLPVIEDKLTRQIAVYGSRVPSSIPMHKLVTLRVDYWFASGPVPGFDARMTGGHSPGHTIFVDDENMVVVAGDALFGEKVLETYGIPFATDIQRYVEVLETTLRDYAKQDYTIIPGHGPIARGRRAQSLVEANIAAVKKLVDTLLELLSAGEKTLEELTAEATRALAKVELTPRQLFLNRTTIASALAWLTEDGKIEPSSTTRGVVWKRKT